MRPTNSDWARQPPRWWPLVVRWRNVVNTPAKLPDRFMLWVDAVGSYLVCLGEEVALGQPAATGAAPEVPILGDLSRRHAVIRRDGEHYSIEAFHTVRLDGKTIGRSAPLCPGNTIELGGVRLRFTRPHPLSATARLEFISRHRTQPSTDGVLLMAETCILGPAAANHVVASKWKQEVVLFRQAEELACRTSAKVTIDGTSHRPGRTTLKPKARVEGEEFAFSLEPIGK
ncbi:MAG TPA: FHA domain-containing protein [Pirellulales bacterium]